MERSWKLLSRAATSLAVLGRQLERADFLARVLDVHLDLALDRSDEPAAGFWTRLMELADWVGGDIDSREQAVELLVAGSVGPSVRRSLAAARSAAQAVRPSLPSELYEQLNSLWWRVEETSRDRDLHGFLIAVELGVHVVQGLIEETMLHDEAREFVRAGKYLQRLDNAVSLVMRKTVELKGEEDALEWTAVLKCGFAFESYRVKFSAEVTGPLVQAFLLFDTDLPRSARFCAEEALRAIRRIDGRRRSRPEHSLSVLAGFLEDLGPAAFRQDPLEFQQEFLRLAGEVTGAMRATYFQPSRVAATVPGDPAARMPQQQQQG